MKKNQLKPKDDGQLETTKNKKIIETNRNCKEGRIENYDEERLRTEKMKL